MQEALETPRPGNVINSSDQTFTDQYGRTSKKGHFNMLFMEREEDLARQRQGCAEQLGLV
eukprot:5211342-Amphidinium_carterae.3